MPTYCFFCKECGHYTEELLAATADKRCTCECGNEMTRDFGAERANIGDCDYRKPIHSDALAINPEQIPEHRRLFPDINVDKEGRPIFDSYKKHDSYLQKIGAVKHKGKPKRRGRKIETTRTKKK